MKVEVLDCPAAEGRGFPCECGYIHFVGWDWKGSNNNVRAPAPPPHLSSLSLLGSHVLSLYTYDVPRCEISCAPDSMAVFTCYQRMGSRSGIQRCSTAMTCRCSFHWETLAPRRQSRTLPCSTLLRSRSSRCNSGVCASAPRHLSQ
jgi:hypothetical protein